jgi:hypothetical protein
MLAPPRESAKPVTKISWSYAEATRRCSDECIKAAAAPKNAAK